MACILSFLIDSPSADYSNIFTDIGTQTRLGQKLTLNCCEEQKDKLGHRQIMIAVDKV